MSAISRRLGGVGGSWYVSRGNFAPFRGSLAEYTLCRVPLHRPARSCPLISSIEITNFRGIREGKLENLTPLTILVGRKWLREKHGAGRDAHRDKPISRHRCHARRAAAFRRKRGALAGCFGGAAQKAFRVGTVLDGDATTGNGRSSPNQQRAETQRTLFCSSGCTAGRVQIRQRPFLFSLSQEADCQPLRTMLFRRPRLTRADDSAGGNLAAAVGRFTGR